MQSITFTCETITPMFLSGADGQTPELRAPSIKGALRFWWRAMNGGNPNMKEDEAKIFGGSGDGEGKSSFSIKILKNIKKGSNVAFPDEKEYRIATYFKENRKNPKTGLPQKSYSINAINYLAFGIADFKGNLNREYICTNEKFTIEFQFKDKYVEQDILKTFVILSKFGGLGSRTRNGFGCFKIEKVERVTKTISVDCSIVEERESITLPILGLSDLAKDEKASFNSFSKEASLVYRTAQNKKSWHEALAEIGKKYQKARQTVESNNPKDTEGKEGWHKYDKRSLLTAPIIVGKGTDSQKTFLDRHAKPYFLHVEKIAENQYQGYVLCLPYNYLAEHPDYAEEYIKDYNSAITDFNKKLK